MGIKHETIYVIGALRNPLVLEVAKALRGSGIDVFADWYTAGPDADDFLRDFYRELGYDYREVLNSHAARNVYEFDKRNLDRCEAALLVMPAGKSAHLELGYMVGRGKPTYILMDGEPERVEIMHRFTLENGGNIFLNKDEAIDYFKRDPEATGGQESGDDPRAEYDRYWGRLALGEGVRDEPWVD